MFMAFEVMEWVRESDQDLVMLFLDFEKAYDKIKLDVSLREHQKTWFFISMDQLDNILVQGGLDFNGCEWRDRRSFHNGKGSSSRMPSNTILVFVYNRCYGLHGFGSFI
jgi:hypothetical protein